MSRVELSRELWDVRRVVNHFGGVEYSVDEDEYMMLCPFHGENNPSMAMSRAGQFICYVCGVRGGSIVDFIAQLFQVPVFTPEDAHQLTALDILTCYSYIESPSREVDEKILAQRLEEQYQANLMAAIEYAHGNFHGDASANKNMDNPTPGVFKMWQKGFRPETLKKFGVVDWQGLPSHQLLIPLRYVKGEHEEVYGYVRRATNGEWPKYLTMTGLRKSDFIYGYCKPWKKKKPIGLITEGMSSLMVAWQHGWREDTHMGACVLGSDVSFNQALAIAADCDSVIGGFDMDLAGEKAYHSLKEALKPFGTRVGRLVLPVNDIGNSSESEFWSGIYRIVKGYTRS